MGATLSDLEENCASKCCGSGQTNEYTIAAEINTSRQQTPIANTKKRNTYIKNKTSTSNYHDNLTKSRHSVDSIEPTEIESSNVDYTHAILDEDYTHKTPSHEGTPITASTTADMDEMYNTIEPTSFPHQTMYSNQMEFMEESIDGHSVSLMSDKIISYDLSHTPSQPTPNIKQSKIATVTTTTTKTESNNYNVFIAPKVVTESNRNNKMKLMDIESTESTRFKKRMFDELIDNNWAYQEIIALISYRDKYNGIWDNLTFDPILSQRHNNVHECVTKYEQIIEYKLKYNKQNSLNLFEQEANLRDIAVYESNPKMVNDGVRYIDGYKDEASQIWKDVQQKKRMLLKRESSRLVLTQKAFKKMKDDTLAFFLHGSKKSLHLSQMKSNQTKMTGFVVGAEIINNKPLPAQINSDIKRVYYTNNNIEYILSISEIDHMNNGILGIFAYNLDTFEYNLLAKFPDFNQDVYNMYFSLYYDQIIQQFHVLCGPKEDMYSDNEIEANGHIWCIYDIENKKCDADMIELNVNKPPIIMVCNGQRVIFNGDLFMKYDEHMQQFIVFDTPHNYKYKFINEMTLCYHNIIYVENQKRIYLFGGCTNASLFTDIWYINIDSDYKWKKYMLSNTQNTHDLIKYKSMECVLCFEYIMLIFVQTEKEKMDNNEIHYDCVYCLDLRQNKMIKAEYKLVGFSKDIIITKDNIIHCITNKSHSKINALELISDQICDFYKKQNIDVVIGFLRIHCRKLREQLSVEIKKIIYKYIPIL